MSEDKIVSLEKARWRHRAENILFGVIGVLIVLALIAPTVARWLP